MNTGINTYLVVWLSPENGMGFCKCKQRCN